MPLIRPQLTALTYAIVAGVIDGEAKTGAEICAAIDWTKHVNSLKRTLRRLVKAGILDSEYSPGDGFCLYRATEAGKQAFRETLDYYVFLASEGPLGRKERGHRDPMRRPSVDEEKRLLKVANEPFRSMYRLMRTLDCLPIEVIRMRVEEIDLHAGIVTIGDRRVMVDVDGRDLLGEIIGERESGPLFAGRNGRRRGEKFMNAHFSELRNQLNLGRNVVLCGVAGATWSRRSKNRNGKLMKGEPR